MVRFTGGNHLAFVTGDMDKTIRFWRDLLGMRLVATLGEQGFRHYFFELSETDTVAFFEWDGAEPVPENGMESRSVVRLPLTMSRLESSPLMSYGNSKTNLLPQTMRSQVR